MDFIGAQMMFLFKAHRYKELESTISEWMQAVQIIQDKQDNTPPPKIACLNCDFQMVDDGSRYLQDMEFIYLTQRKSDVMDYSLEET